MRKPLVQMLSPMIKNRDRLVTQTLDKSDVLLMEKIKKSKLEILHNSFSPGQNDLVRPEVNESWIRSRNYNLKLFDYNCGPTLDGAAFEELLGEKGLLLKAAQPYLLNLETMLSHTSCMVLLSDEEGVMLRVLIGNQKLFKQINKRFQLSPGVVWTEKTIGTCAHGISLLLGIPMQICGPEHYSEKFGQISCSSAPIFDVNDNLAATLSIVSPYLQNSHFLSLAVSTAWAIQNEYQLALNRELFDTALEATDEAVIIINRRGIIVRASAAARKTLDFWGRDLIGMPIEDILGKQPLVDFVLRVGEPVKDAEIESERLNRRLCFSAQPQKDRNGNNFGCVLTLKEIERNRRREKPTGQAQQAVFTFAKIVGSSPQIIKSIETAKRFARLDVNILIQGESGTGKELFAQAIHNESRPDGPFIAINCAAIPKNLIASELFGYEGGAFTGADRQGRPGKIELANGGTLFLDEIGDMPLELQPVILRAIEEKRIMRIGGKRCIPVDFRLIAATNKDLLDMVKNKQFRGDLYYRLKVLELKIPPLRERGPDIVRLAKHFIALAAQKLQIPTPSLSDEAVFHLLKYSWPGNVRELENAMFHAVSMSSNGVIEPGDLPEEIGASPARCPVKDHTGLELIADSRIAAAPNLSLKEIEKITIIQALLQTQYNISEAAKILGMSRSTLYRKIRDNGLKFITLNRNTRPKALGQSQPR